MNSYEKHWTKVIGEISDLLTGAAQELDSLPAFIALPTVATTIKFLLTHRLNMARMEKEEPHE